MKKELELLPPTMPNFAVFKQIGGLKQDGFKAQQGLPIKDFTEEEAYEYAELMKQTFIKHWESKQTKKQTI